MPKSKELSVSSSGPTVHLEFLDEGIIAVLTLDDFKGTNVMSPEMGDARPLPRASGLVRGTPTATWRPQLEKPPREYLGGGIKWAWLESALDRVSALTVIGPSGRYRQAHLLAEGATDEPADRMRLPASSLYNLLQGGAVGPSKKGEHLGAHATLSGAHGGGFRFLHFLA
jgi:hypothetical protein